jgi:hypothetical protein
MSQSPYHNPYMGCYRLNKTEMNAHNCKTILKALPMPLLGLTTHQVICDDKTGMDIFAAQLEYLNAPIIISAKIVRDIERR